MKRSREEEQTLPKPELTKKPDSDQPQGIDRLVHFIWAGGDDIMVKDSIEIVTAWAKANKEFKVILWVDARFPLNEQIDEGKLSILFTQYQAIFNKVGINVFLNEVHADYTTQDQPSAPIIIRDITQYNLINPYIRYEIDKVEPNYGSSSDLLRYHILDRYGAAYGDSDVGPGEDPLLSCNLFTQLPPCHHLYLDHVSQRVNPPEICIEYFELFYPVQIPNSTKTFQPIPGNDAFICTPENPLMKEIVRCTEENYQLPKLNDMSKFIMAAYGGADIPRQTIDRTGTTPVQTVLSNSRPRNIEGDYYEMLCLGQAVHVFPLRHSGLKLMQPVKNTRNWIKRIDWDAFHKGSLINRLVNQTLQEIKFFGALRLSDHTAFLREFAINRKENPEKWISDYYSKLEESTFPLHEVKIAQLVSIDPLVYQFYTKHHLFEKTFLLKESRSKDFQEICDLVTSKDKLAELASNIKLFGKEYMQGVYNSGGDRYHLYNTLNEAVNFIELLISNPERYQRMMSGEMLICLENVKMIASSFSEKLMEAGLKFDFDRLERVITDCRRDPRKQDQEDAMQFLKMYLSATPDKDTHEKPKNPKDESKGFK